MGLGGRDEGARVGTQECSVVHPRLVVQTVLDKRTSPVRPSVPGSEVLESLFEGLRSSQRSPSSVPRPQTSSPWVVVPADVSPADVSSAGVSPADVSPAGEL